MIKGGEMKLLHIALMMCLSTPSIAADRDPFVLNSTTVVCRNQADTFRLRGLENKPRDYVRVSHDMMVSGDCALLPRNMRVWIEYNVSNSPIICVYTNRSYSSCGWADVEMLEPLPME